MSDFKAKNVPNSISAEALLQIPLGSLQRPQTTQLDLRGLLLRGGVKTCCPISNKLLPPTHTVSESAGDYEHLYDFWPLQHLAVERKLKAVEIRSTS